MMVDLDDDPEWSVSDELDDEDSERYSMTFFLHSQLLKYMSST